MFDPCVAHSFPDFKKREICDKKREFYSELYAAPLLAAWQNQHLEVVSALLAAGANDVPRFYPSTIVPSADGFDLAAIVAASREHIATEDGAPTCPHSYVRGWDLRKCERCDADVGGERRRRERRQPAARHVMV